jgi:hypothetical protein
MGKMSAIAAAEYEPRPAVTVQEIDLSTPVGQAAILRRSQLTPEQRDVLAAIDRTIAKCEAGGLTHIVVYLKWAYYQQLLAIRGIDWTPSERTDNTTAKHEDRPIKTYGDYPLRLTYAESVVYSEPPGGPIHGHVIQFDRR